ncbi:MAG: RNA methyltransferase [Chloroflexi bacterium]|nr:RNA methyltransferase [Chloroflexota bacterium]
MAESEIRAKLPEASLQESLRGKVLFGAAASPDRPLALRTVDNVYVLAGRFPVGPRRAHLKDLESTMARLDLREAAAAALGRRAGKYTSFYVNASRAGKHTYSRFEAAEAAARGVLARHAGWRPGSATEHDLELRLDVVGDEALLSVRLTPPAFRFRGAGRAFSPAALRPPVAHALVWLSGPEPDDRFVDPFCGSGTILAERLPYPARRVIGGDRSAEALAAAHENVAGDRRVSLQQWDARRLPLSSQTIDKVVTNLPFGRQVLNQAEIPAVYRAVSEEIARVLTPRGGAVVLTEQVTPLEIAARDAGLAVEPVATLSLKGLNPKVLRLRYHSRTGREEPNGGKR